MRGERRPCCRPSWSHALAEVHEVHEFWLTLHGWARIARRNVGPFFYRQALHTAAQCSSKSRNAQSSLYQGHIRVPSLQSVATACNYSADKYGQCTAV